MTMRPKRKGTTLIELTIAALLLAVALGITARALGWAVAQHRAAERRVRAVEEAANVLERLVATPDDALTPAMANATGLSAAARAALPGGELRVALAEPTAADDGPKLKRITVEVRWSDRAGAAEAPVRLTAWVARRGGTDR